jgi:hypothetical protein
MSPQSFSWFGQRAIAPLHGTAEGILKNRFISII